MCLYPKLIFNQKYWPNKKNGGIVPEIKDKRVLKVPVGCGRCIECKKQKARQWTVRLSEEIRHKEGVFVSMTWSNESYTELDKLIDPIIEGYERDNAIATLGVRRFLERFRKENKVSCKHWLVTELGQEGTENIHVHGIIWASREQIEKHWGKNGFAYMGNECSERTINYIVKYISKTDDLHPNYQAKILCSAGIGSKYFDRSDAEKNKYKPNETKEYYQTKSGLRLNMPIYYRNKIYTDEEREKLWIEKLDKNERWVMGCKINMNTEEGVKLFYEKLEYEQQENKRMGYMGRKEDWEQKQYEITRRELNQKKRKIIKEKLTLNQRKEV